MTYSPTYLLLNLAFTLVASLAVWALRKKIKFGAARWTLVALLASTLVFDNLIVGFGIVGYDPNQILGLKLGFAPVEDFGYAVVAAFLVPAVFRFFGPRRGGEK